jgi:hypothetical protein
VVPLPGIAGVTAAPGSAAAAAQAAALAYKTCQEQAVAAPAADADSDGIANGTELLCFYPSSPRLFIHMCLPLLRRAVRDLQPGNVVAADLT